METSGEKIKSPNIAPTVKATLRWIFIVRLQPQQQ